MKFSAIKALMCLCISLWISPLAFSWGFFAHKKINNLAIFTLPPEMIVFYKKNIDLITENAVNPDKRRYALKEEAPRHFIDLNVYGDSLQKLMNLSWVRATEVYTEDSLMRHGILPWHLYLVKYKLTEAFRTKNTEQIIKLSADIGHYIADAHVPLHTTSNYNGQFTNQHGIHGFWESRLPELFFEKYDFFVGPADYIENTQKTFWEVVFTSHSAVDSVLSFEKTLNEKFSQDKKYGFEEKGGVIVKVYSREYSEAYHKMLGGQIERQMRASVKMVGNIWYTCWVDAGQPDLKEVVEYKISEEESKEMEKEKHETHDGCNH